MMKYKLLFSLLLLTLGFSVVRAQDEVNFDAPKQQSKMPNRPNLLRELGLNQDQIRQMRMINAVNKEKMQEAHFRLREANRQLDAAIYAETADETLIQTRLRALIEIQAEIAKIRTMTEFAIRKVLTPEQLVRFRELRQRFQQMRQQPRQEAPLRKFPNRKPPTN